MSDASCPLIRSAVLCGAVVVSANAATYVVDPGGSADFETIQAAIDACAADGDSVDVNPGEYGEHLLIVDKTIVVRGLAEPPAISVLSAEYRRVDMDEELLGGELRRMSVLGSITTTGVTRDFTLAELVVADTVDLKGQAAMFGPSFALRDSELHGDVTMIQSAFYAGLSVTGCVFVSADLSTGGGLGYTSVGGCEFIDADVSVSGSNGSGAVYTSVITNGDVAAGGRGGTVEDCTVVNGNVWVSGSIGCGANDNVVLDGYIRLTSPFGSARRNEANLLDVDCGDSYAEDNRVRSLRFSGYATGRGNVVTGGDVGIYAISYLFLENNTVVDCSEIGIHLAEPSTHEGNQFSRNLVVGCGIGVKIGEGGPIVVECNDVWDSAVARYDGMADVTGVDGNFSADPFLCDRVGGDYTLAANSPCLPGHHPDGSDCGTVGALGEGCEAVYVVNASDVSRADLRCVPNPFRRWTHIMRAARIRSSQEATSLEILDVGGRRVRRLVLRTGETVRWDGLDQRGRPIAPGVYFVRVGSPERAETVRVVRRP